MTLAVSCGVALLIALVGVAGATILAVVAPALMKNTTLPKATPAIVGVVCVGGSIYLLVMFAAGLDALSAGGC